MQQTKQPSILKSLALAFATVALSTWALGSLWLHSSAADDGPDVVAEHAP